LHCKPLIAIAAVTGLLAVPDGAAAHVTVQPSSAPAGQFVRLDVRVPNEQDKASTNKVSVQFPPGFIFASYEPVPGWKVTVKRSKLDTPVTAEGEKFTEQVSEMTWTGSGSEGKIGPGQFQDFGVSVQIPDKAGTKLKFPAVQTYDNGDVSRWIGAESSEEPAPLVDVTAASGAESGSSGTTGSTGTTGDTEETSSGGESGGGEESSSGDEDSKTLSIIALVVGGLGLVLGGVALSSARRRRTT
jgi:uncharacterized protein YcnI